VYMLVEVDTSGFLSKSGSKEQYQIENEDFDVEEN